MKAAVCPQQALGLPPSLGFRYVGTKGTSVKKPLNETQEKHLHHGDQWAPQFSPMRPLQSADGDPGWGSVMFGTTSSTHSPRGEVEISKVNHVQELDSVILRYETGFQ